MTCNRCLFSIWYTEVVLEKLYVIIILSNYRTTSALEISHHKSTRRMAIRISRNWNKYAQNVDADVRRVMTWRGFIDNAE